METMMGRFLETLGRNSIEAGVLVVVVLVAQDFKPGSLQGERRRHEERIAEGVGRDQRGRCIRYVPERVGDRGVLG